MICPANPLSGQKIQSPQIVVWLVQANHIKMLPSYSMRENINNSNKSLGIYANKIKHNATIAWFVEL